MYNPLNLQPDEVKQTIIKQVDDAYDQAVWDQICYLYDFSRTREPEIVVAEIRRIYARGKVRGTRRDR